MKVMPNIFQSLKQVISPGFLGVDIGTSSIKVVEVRHGQKFPAVSNYAILESTSSLLRANSVFQSSSLKISENEIIDVLMVVAEKLKPQARDAVASLPIFSVFTTILNFPEMKQEEIAKTISFQAQEYIPAPLSEVALDWIKVGGYRDEQGFLYEQVLLISVPQEYIRKYQKIFKAVGWNLKVLEIESFALIRSLIGNDPTPTFIIDIGSNSTLIAIAEGGQLKFNSQSDFAGASLTQSLSSSLNINPLRAEELKKDKGVVGTGPDYGLSTIMLPFLDVIISEVKRVEYNYHNQFPNAAKIERAILSGGGANLLGIEKHFERELGMPVVKSSPLSRFEHSSEIEPLAGELNPLLSVALGLGLKEF